MGTEQEDAMYHQLVHFAGTWGLGLLALLFAIAVAYAVWPGNRDRFRRMAELPLDDDEEPISDKEARP